MKPFWLLPALSFSILIAMPSNSLAVTEQPGIDPQEAEAPPQRDGRYRLDYPYETRKDPECLKLEIRWPVLGVLKREFHPKTKGVDFSTIGGMPIHAVQLGVVAFAGQHRPYGKLIIIRHPFGYVSVYAHNRELKVAKGAIVEAGQEIASAPQGIFHFQLRKGSDNPIDPVPCFDDYAN